MISHIGPVILKCTDGMNTSTERTCANCLNAYTNDHVVSVYCSNKDFKAQFTPGYDCTVKADETCCMWTKRRNNQPKLDFHKALQLSLF